MLNRAAEASTDTFWETLESFHGPRKPPAIKGLSASSVTEVDRYWGEHTVNSTPFKTARASRRYLEWRSKAYPLFAEFMQLYRGHDDEVVLDYGCGPGNDLVGFSIYTRAKKIIGIDVSDKALELARGRLALHHVPPERVELIHSGDSVLALPLDNASVDYIHCAGVLQHTSSPESLLKEFYRVLKPNSRACVMVYNYDSLYLHVFTAYQRQIVEGVFAGLGVREAFSRNVDGVNCPIARCYGSEQFIPLTESAGFDTEYVGGYFSQDELASLARYGAAAVADERLADEHKEFIRNLVRDEDGLPKFQGKHAGVGGTYRLHKT